MSHSLAPRSRARILMLWLAGLLTALLAVGGLSTPAVAAGGKVTVFPVDSGSSHNGTPVLTEGSTYPFQLGYGSMDDGAVVVIDVPDGITIPTGALQVPAGNTAVRSLEIDDAGRLVVTFMDPFPGDVSQGVLDLSLSIDAVESSEARELVWAVDGERTTQRIIIVEQGDSPQNTTTGAAKSAGQVSIPHSIVDGTVVMGPEALEAEIPYTITVSSADAREVSIADTLGDDLILVDGSLAGSRVVRDENGLNPVNTALSGLPAISGTSFSHTFSAEARSVYTFTYRARIADAEALDAVRDRLQQAYDAVDTLDGGSYSVELTNSATINGQEHTARTRVGGTVPGQPRPGTGAAFTKTVDPSEVALEQQLEGGAALANGIPVTYTLGADLTVFADFADGPFALSRNVVIRDTLSDQAQWNLDGADSLVLTDAGGTRIALSPARELGGDIESAIAADEYVNTYAVSGRTLYVNVGKDVTAAYTLTAAATITALPARSASETPYEARYRVDNTASFVYADGRWETKGAATTITVPKDTSTGVDDPSRFSKRAPTTPLTVTPGSPALVPFTFTIGAGVGDAASSRIVDLVDHSVFDVSDETLPQIAASLTGAYDWNYPLDADTFDVSLDDDGNLVIAPNADFPKEASWGAEAQRPLTASWTVTVQIPTHPVQGKQSIDVTNAARLEGEGQEIVYTSQARASATSFGNEMEVRKRVYDAANDAFTGNLRVGLDADGGLLNDEFVYRVELLPHGTFSNMVEDVVDVLPDGVEFLGFVAPGDVSSGTTTGGATWQIPGSSLTAVYDTATDTVTLERGRLAGGQTVSLFFKVRVVDHTANVGITNVIGSSGATITPTNDYPLSLLKRDSTDAAALITDAGARFSVLSSDRDDVVLSDLRVVDGRIVTADGATPVVTEPGEYWLREDVAPSGYLRTTELSRIVVEETGAAADVVLYNTPGVDPEPERTYAVGDVVWIDADRDGVQSDGEQVLPGVTVDLIRDGEVIATTKTDDRGRYLFDELPAGQYRVRFTLTPEQQRVYTFTTANAGDDDAVDSDADPETGLTTTIVLGPDNIRLTKDYAWADLRATEGIDPTWDAGVVVRADAPQVPGDGDTDPSLPGTPGVNELPRTGGAIPFALAGIAVALMLAGAALIVRRRSLVRRRSA